jgi:RNA polymerase sigma-70 factor (family 1)
MNLVQSVCEDNNFKKLYKDYAKPLRNFLYYRCGDLERSEDIVQEAMVKMWQNCAQVVFEKAKSFLYTVGLRMLMDQFRHDKVKLQFAKQAEMNTAEDASFNLIKKEFEQKLEKAISDLPETQREAFLMNRIDKMSYAEIAEALDISVKAVEKRMHLALTTLKESVKELKTYKI